MRLYTWLWIVITAYLGYEYWALDSHQALSTIAYAQRHGWIRQSIKLTTDPGSTISLWLGSIGFGLMIAMNGYSVRKRLRSLSKLGRLSQWMDFHIFCGIVGPTLILFHCQLKVRGIVGISFWSMVVSFSSGVIGRYFLLQIAGKRHEWDQRADKWIAKLDEILTGVKIQIDGAGRNSLLSDALVTVGGSQGHEEIGPISAFFRSVAGDLRASFSPPGVPSGWPSSTQTCLLQYALCKRRAQFIGAYQRLMGYWHAFHFPFAVFMYLAAVIHIVSSLIFWRAS